MMKSSGQWQTLSGGAAPLDSSGWPTSDARILVFDVRPFGAWAPPEDDPEHYQQDMSGTYKVSFNGTAKLSSYGSPFTIQNQKYNSATNETALDLIFQKNQGLLIITFSGTTGGVNHVKIIRPGYAGDSKTFRTELIDALCPFSTIRFMDWTLADNSTPAYTNTDHVTHWSNRKLPADATQGQWGTKKDGVAWEYCIDLCNQTQKDIWINVPVAADDDYVRQLAMLLKNTLHPSLKIYVEYSNEVWNSSFTQFNWNKSAALDEIAKGHSNLNDDGETFGLYLAARRFARRTKEIGEIFGSVFGASSFGSTYRPVLASQIAWTEPILQGLRFIARQYGPPRNYYYAVAGAPYFGNSNLNRTATVEQVIDSMRANSDNSRKLRNAYHDIAVSYGLPLISYEGGPDVGGGDTTNIANRITASRDTAMGSAVLHDLRDNWFPLGGDLFLYFTLNGNVSRYGCWGALEDLTKPTSPKYLALEQLSGACLASVPLAPTMPGRFGLKVVTNPSTRLVTLQFDLPERATHATIGVTNVVGQQVLDGPHIPPGAGHFEAALDLTSLSEGTYYITLTAGGITEATSVCLTR
jgi:hypothetical protein